MNAIKTATIRCTIGQGKENITITTSVNGNKVVTGSFESFTNPTGLVLNQPEDKVNMTYKGANTQVSVILSDELVSQVEAAVAAAGPTKEIGLTFGVQKFSLPTVGETNNGGTVSFIVNAISFIEADTAVEGVLTDAMMNATAQMAGITSDMGRINALSQKNSTNGKAKAAGMAAKLKELFF